MLGYLPPMEFFMRTGFSDCPCAPQRETDGKALACRLTGLPTCVSSRESSRVSSRISTSVLACVLPGFFAVLPARAAPAADVAAAAREQIGVTVLYDPSYRQLAYPGGDVPIERGVCTDVVVRAFRRIGIDLQALVHRDMRAAWKTYPHPAGWGSTRPDPNIDHRRVPNLATFFARHGQSLPPSRTPADYAPGDIVTWTVPPGLPHIGLVADLRSPAGVPLVIHNIGAGTRMENRLFAWPLTGHYRYPAPASRITGGSR